MPTELSATPHSLAGRVHRMTLSMEVLSARIARLARLLDVSLQSEAELTRLLARELGQQAAPDRRQARMREELRGLLVLRYSAARRCADEVGASTTRFIMLSAEEQLVREGFKPGANGFDARSLS
jgi:hypothetical protein